MKKQKESGIMKTAQTLAVVHTHTHTHVVLKEDKNTKFVFYSHVNEGEKF